MPDGFFSGVVGALLGALMTAVIMQMRFTGRLARVEGDIEHLKNALQGEKDRTDERIFRLASMVEKVLDTANGVIENSGKLMTRVDTLLDELKAARGRS